MKLTEQQVIDIVKGYDLNNIMKLNEDEQDNAIHEIILDCMSHERVEVGTADFDTLYQQYEKIVYSVYRAQEDEQERQYIIDCAKKEIAFYNALLIDWKNYHEALFDKSVEWFELRGCDVNNDTLDEYDTTALNGEKQHRKQVDILGTFCGFTLQEINGETEIGYIWVFNGYSDELYIDDKGEVQSQWQR